MTDQPEENLTKHQRYYRKNREQRLEQVRELKAQTVLTCEVCNVDIKKYNFTQHCASRKHKSNLPPEDAKLMPHRKNRDDKMATLENVVDYLKELKCQPRIIEQAEILPYYTPFMHKHLLFALCTTREAKEAAKGCNMSHRLYFLNQIVIYINLNHRIRKFKDRMEETDFARIEENIWYGTELEECKGMIDTDRVAEFEKEFEWEECFAKYDLK